VLNSIGRYRDAATTNAEALRLDPLSPIINTNAGIDSARFGRDDEAESRFRHAIELDPAFPVPYSGMARLKASRGLLDESLRWIQQAVERAPTRAFYLARKGFLYLQLGHLDRAQEWLLAARSHAADSHFIGDAELALAIAADDRNKLESVAGAQDDCDAAQNAVAAWVLGDEKQALSLYEQKCPEPELLIFEMINDEWVWRFPHSLYRARLRQLHGDAGAAADAQSFLDSIEKIRNEGIVNLNTEYWAAVALVIVGREEAALDRLDKAIDSGWRNLWWARVDPALVSLAARARFGQLLARTAKLIATSADRLNKAQ
jgi:tetratricopeptide (TPR) repeat protein